MPVPHVLLVNGVEGRLLQGEDDFDETFVIGGHGLVGLKVQSREFQ